MNLCEIHINLIKTNYKNEYINFECVIKYTLFIKNGLVYDHYDITNRI